MDDNKTIGICGIVFSMVGFLCLFLIDKSKLIFDDISAPFIVRNFLFIAILNGCIYFFIYGVLQYFNFIVPYYSTNRTELDKIKNFLLGIILLIPIWFSSTATIFYMSKNFLIQISWGCFIIILILKLGMTLFKYANHRIHWDCFILEKDL